jgi:hypothetical protein
MKRLITFLRGVLRPKPDAVPAPTAKRACSVDGPSKAFTAGQIAQELCETDIMDRLIVSARQPDGSIDAAVISALLFSKYPNATAEDVRRALVVTDELETIDVEMKLRFPRPTRPRSTAPRT